MIRVGSDCYCWCCCCCQSWVVMAVEDGIDRTSAYVAVSLHKVNRILIVL